MKRLFILELLLLSQKERKAKRVIFDRKRTLIHGKNHTGKSSLIKSIYWAFGAEPLLNAKFKSANVSALVIFELDGVVYSILRDGKQFGVFNMNGELLNKSTSVTKELAPFLGDLFEFTPLFQTSSNEFIIPPPAFLFLPYYIDQDTSWSSSWSSFKALQQVKDFRTQSIFYHSGIRPNEYYSTKRDIETFVQTIDETEKEQRIIKKVLVDVKEKLSQTNFNIDLEGFKNEITELLAESELLRKKEEKLKNTLHELYHIKAIYDSQIIIVKQAIAESEKDLVFATDELPDYVSCPTCGAEYANSFSERFEIARDEMKGKDLLIELAKEAKEIDRKIKAEMDALTTTGGEVSKIDKILEEKKGDLKLKDIIDSAGKNQVSILFKQRHSELQDVLIHNAREKSKLDKKLKAYESKERKEKITSFYKNKMALFLNRLDVHSVSSKDYNTLLSKIELKETGSSRPRALIAYYFSFFHLMSEFSSSTYCPLIIDSPNQQDQDIEHIDKIMTFINNNQPQESQLILGLAETYGVDFNCPVVELSHKYSLLSEEEYSEVYSIMTDKLNMIWF